MNKLRVEKKVVNKNIVRHKNYDLHSNFIRHGFCGDSDHPLTPCKLITLSFLSTQFYRQRERIEITQMMFHESSIERAHDV